MKKFLLSLAALLTLGLSANAETKTYQLCTVESEILNPDNQFVMIAAKVLNGNVYAVGNSFASKAYNIIDIKKGVSQVDDSFNIDVESLGIGLYSIKANGSTYHAIYENSKNFFMGGSSKTDMVQTSGTSVPSGNAYQIALTYTDGTIKMVSQAGTTREFMISGGNSAFKNYASSNASAADYSEVRFYKEVAASGAIDPSYSGYETEGYTLEIGEVLSLEGKILPKELNYTFTSTDPTVIQVDNNAKTFTALKAGTATINFTTEAIADKFKEGSGSFTITVTKIAPELSFADQIIIGKYPVGVVWQPVIITKPENADDHGVLTYSTSDDTIIKIDPSTGQIKPEDVLAAGEVTITATLAETETYAEGSASYTIILKDPNGEVTAGTSKFDFTTKDPYGMTTTSNSSTYEKKVKEIEADDVTTITFEGQYRSWQKTSGGVTSYELRVNKDAENKFTINVPEGYTISAIGMVGGKINGAYTPAGVQDINEIESPDEWDSDVKLTWHAAPNETVTHVEFDNSGTETAQISTIWVQYQPAGASLQSAALSFGKVVNNILMEEEATINAVKNPNNRQVSYHIAHLSEDEYTITPSEDGKTLKVLVKTPGFYTLEATSPAGDGYRDGFAIMRLNVYRHLDVFANDIEVTDEHIKTDSDVTVTFRVPELAKIYWQIIDDENPSSSEITPSDDEDQEAGFELYEDEINIDKGLNGKLVFYIANYGYASPKRTILLGDAEEVPVHEIEESENLTLDGNYITGAGPIKIKFKAIDGYHIYFSLDTNASRRNVKAQATTRAACTDDHAGFEKHNGEEITLSSKHSALSFYACNPATGVHSNLTTYNLSLQTGVAEIEIAKGEAVYYSLDGQKVEATKLVPGVYIRVKDNKTTKVLVK